jgi:DNA-binding protein H-NS
LVELQAKIKAYKSLDGLGHMLRDAVRHRMAHGAPPPAEEAGAAAGGETASSVKIPGALDNSEFQNAPKSVRALAAEVDSIDIKKGGDFNFNAANLDTSKFSVAMTHVDAMVTKMKLALDCLKQYLAYYQTGASQIQSIYKTEHESIVAVIKEKTTDLMAANVQMHENYQELLNQLTILKSVLGSCSLLNTAMKASTDLNQDGFASLQQQWEITQQTKVDPAKCAKHEPIKPAAKLKRKPRKPRKPVNDQNAEALTQIAATISDVDVDVTGVRTESTPTGF